MSVRVRVNSDRRGRRKVIKPDTSTEAASINGLALITSYPPNPPKQGRGTVARPLTAHEWKGN